MRKLLLLGVALATVSAAAPVMAQSSADTSATVGATAGGATGGTIGFLLGGPIGAIVGGWAGAVIGADAAVSQDSIRYAGENPVDGIYLDSNIDVGYRVGGEVTVYPIEGDDRYGYFYANNRVWIVDLETNEVVQSPGYTIRNDAVAYIEANPVNDAGFTGELSVGVSIGNDVELVEVPDYRGVSYIYVDGRPVLIDSNNRTVLWIG